jgi:sugar-specific transcriptional regulator TrmB
VREELYKLGFSPKEAAIYLLLFNLGTAQPSVLARMSGIKRPTVYAALKNLEERNLVYSYKKGRVTYFVIDDPKKVLHQEKEKYEAAQNLVDRFAEATKNVPQVIEVQYYKGTEGYREMYEDILRTEPEVINIWINYDVFLKGIDPKREEKWTKERIKKKIYARLLAQKTPAALDLKKKDKTSCREVRFLPKDPYFETTCILFDNKIMLFDATAETNCICITNPAFYKMFMAVFEKMWAEN